MNQGLMDVGPRRQMFIDGRFIAQSDGIALHVHPPALRGPALRGERPWETGYIGHATLIQDGDTLKLWYICHEPGEYGMKRKQREGGKLGVGHFCYATSQDGVRWERPNLGLVSYRGSTENNIITTVKDDVGEVFLDPRAPPHQRYKMLQCLGADKERGGLHIACSPDGLRWTRHPRQLLPFHPDTQNQVLYDPRIDKYVAYLRSWAPLRKVCRVEVQNLLEPWPYDRQAARPADDGIPHIPVNELPHAISYDELDLPETDIYTPAVSLYPWAEDVYVALPSVYYHFDVGQRGITGLIEVQLAVSRDGARFERPNRSRAYIPLGLSGGPEGGSIYMAPGLARLGDEIYHYYVPYATPHELKQGEWVEGWGAVHLAVQRLDGFMSADAAYTGGWLVTPPLTFSGRRLELNIDCGATGHAAVALIAENGVPAQGFSAEDCDLIRGNHVHHTVTWKGSDDVSAFRGRPIRLRLTARNSSLYAFQFCEEARKTG